MKTVDIKGKKYVEVKERIKEFHRAYPNGSIFTKMLSNDNGVCIFQAIVTPDVVTEDRAYTGHAYEKEDSTFINKTSYIENCETSAVGRALGMLGIGIDGDIASADEVLNATNVTYIDEKQLNTLKDFVDNNDGFEARLLKYLKVASIDKIPKTEYNKAIKAMEAVQ